MRDVETRSIEYIARIRIGHVHRIEARWHFQIRMDAPAQSQLSCYSLFDTGGYKFQSESLKSVLMAHIGVGQWTSNRIEAGELPLSQSIRSILLRLTNC